MERKESIVPEGCLPFDSLCYLGLPISADMLDGEHLLAFEEKAGCRAVARYSGLERDAAGHLCVIYKSCLTDERYMFLSQEKSLRKLIDHRPDSR